jgi:hypothetical protein
MILTSRACQSFDDFDPSGKYSKKIPSVMKKITMTSVDYGEDVRSTLNSYPTQARQSMKNLKNLDDILRKKNKSIVQSELQNYFCFLSRSKRNQVYSVQKIFDLLFMLHDKNSFVKVDVSNLLPIFNEIFDRLFENESNYRFENDVIMQACFSLKGSYRTLVGILVSSLKSFLL